MFASIFKAFGPVMSWAMAVSEVHRSVEAVLHVKRCTRSRVYDGRVSLGGVNTNLEKLGCTK